MARAKAHCGKSIWLQVAFVIVNILLLVFDGVAGTPNPLYTKMRRLVKPFKKPAATIKTIKGPNGDVIDCVDIYKQPAFDHPALKNHTIQMRPSDDTEEIASNTSSSVASLAQLWRVNGRCPGGTIPILRTRKSHLLIENSPTIAPVIESAKLVLSKDTYSGASAYLNVWNGQHVELREDASSSIILGSKRGDNFIVAGWAVSEPLYGDQETRLSIYWTADGSHETGCHDLNCAGFIQTNPQIYLGGDFNATSVYGGNQIEIFLSVFLDPKSKNWWLKFLDEAVGYWLTSIFKDFYTAAVINWGGSVGLSSGGGARHYTIEVGNGHYPHEGFTRSTYVSGAQYRGSDNKYYWPYEALLRPDKPQCYDTLDYGMGYFDRPGRAFFFGGDGQGQGCHK